MSFILFLPILSTTMGLFFVGLARAISSKKQEPKEKKQVLKYKEPVEFELGATSIELEFSDGTIFTIWVYGYMHLGYPTTSKSEAQNFLRRLNGYTTSYVDDALSPTSGHVGVVKHAIIGKTRKYTELHQESYMDYE